MKSPRILSTSAVVLLAALVTAPDSSQAAISVPTAPGVIWDFAGLPAAADWSTIQAGVAGSDVTISDEVTMNATVQTLTQAAIAQVLTQSVSINPITSN